MKTLHQKLVSQIDDQVPVDGDWQLNTSRDTFLATATMLKHELDADDDLIVKTLKSLYDACMEEFEAL